MKSEKICRNCRYFVQHYRKAHATYMPVHCGFCENRVLTPREKRSFPSIVDCPFWEPIEVQFQLRRQDISETLQTIAGRLDIISQILLDDENQKNRSE